MKIRSLSIFLCIVLIGQMLVAIEIPLTRAQVLISVSVTGNVDKPGTHQVNALSRLSDVIESTKAEKLPVQSEAIPAELKNLDVSPVPVQKEEEIEKLIDQALRSVALIRDGVTTRYDLRKFYICGDITQNPMLRDGDVVHVGTIQKSVSIQGAVFKPGDYEYLASDTIKDIIDLAQGLKPEADLKNAKIYRYRQNMMDFDVIDLDLSSFHTNPKIGETKLNDADRILIPVDSQFRRQWKVTLEGNIKSPGEYLISNQTTLYDVLLLAGGPTERADLYNAIVINQIISDKLDPDFERLKTMSMSMVTPMEYNYLRAKLRQLKAKYSLDVLDAWESKGARNNPILTDGDLIYIPEQNDMIWVSGQVCNPGLVKYQPGKNFQYYIEQAGGYTNNRKFNGTMIIRHNSGNWVRPSKKLPIRPGDTIFVAEKTDRDLWVDVKDFVLLTSQLVTIFIAMRTISNY